MLPIIRGFPLPEEPKRFYAKPLQLPLLKQLLELRAEVVLARILRSGTRNFIGSIT